MIFQQIENGKRFGQVIKLLKPIIKAKNQSFIF